MTEFEKLCRENELLREIIDNHLPVATTENKNAWKLINKLINNEVEQEALCNN